MDGLTIRSAGTMVNTGGSTANSDQTSSVSRPSVPEAGIDVGSGGLSSSIGSIDGSSSRVSGPLGPVVGADQTQKSFAATLKDAVGQVNALQKESDHKMQELATGKTQNIHETMIAAEKADIALRLMVQVRNKMIEAYQEIMRMQV